MLFYRPRAFAARRSSHILECNLGVVARRRWPAIYPNRYPLELR
jgi:hypothetical protein